MRTAAAARRSGIDPDGKQLRRLHAIKTSRAKNVERAHADYTKACESIENYWRRVEEALKDQQAIHEVHH